MKDRKTIDMLTKDSVSIITTKVVGEVQQSDDIHRAAYENSVNGRILLENQEPEEVSEVVLNYWGDNPTVTFPLYSQYGG